MVLAFPLAIGNRRPHVVSRKLLSTARFIAGRDLPKSPKGGWSAHRVFKVISSPTRTSTFFWQRVTRFAKVVNEYNRYPEGIASRECLRRN